MELGRQDLVEILRIVEQANVEYLEIESGGDRLTISKNGLFIGGVGEAAGRPGAADGPPVAAGRADETGDGQEVPGAAPEAAVPDGCVAVTAPTVGLFYRRPEPGAAPFVEVGARVGAGATLALLEVMKVYNAVTSPVDGVVEAILAGDEEAVEYGQALFAVREAEPPPA